jgi:hypothetical protein
MPERAGSSTRRGSAEAKDSKRQEIAVAADCFNWQCNRLVDKQIRDLSTTENDGALIRWSRVRAPPAPP